jgi:protein SCO1/2
MQPAQDWLLRFQAVSEKQQSSLPQALIWGCLFLVIAGIVLLYVRGDRSRVNLPVYTAVQPFTLTNQLGAPFSSASLLGKVWLADVIFTRCGGPCPKMTEKMANLAQQYRGNDQVAFATISTDPAFDTPKVLADYSKRFGADPAQWHFLTGSKDAIQQAAADSLKMAAVEKAAADQEAPNDLFIHTTVFVLVDKKGQIRGTFESLEPEFEKTINRAIQTLLRERI